MFDFDGEVEGAPAAEEEAGFRYAAGLVQRPGGDWEFDWRQVEKPPLTLPFITVPTEFSREAIRDRTLRMVRRKELGIDAKAAVLEKKKAAEDADNEQWRSVLSSLAGCADYETW